MSSIRSILEELAAEQYDDGWCASNVDKPHDGPDYDAVDQALLEISQIINPIISDIDRLYTDEYDRKLWNEFKYEVQSNLKEALK